MGEDTPAAADSSCSTSTGVWDPSHSGCCARSAGHDGPDPCCRRCRTSSGVQDPSYNGSTRRRACAGGLML